MSGTEEDDLISQSDIDKLLEASGKDEIDADSSDSNDIADDLGELSQDDIDKLMNSNLSAQSEPDGPDILEKLDQTDTGKSEDDEMELISQEDIDQLMNSNMASKEGADTEMDLEAGPGEEDFGELSQDDIDQLMNSNMGSDKKQAPPMDDEEEFEELSKDDIKALMGDSGLASETGEGPEEGLDEIPDLDLDKSIFENSDGVEAEKPAKTKASGPDEFVIKESEAVDVSTCLITQAALDRLASQFDAQSGSETVVLDEEQEMDLQSGQIPETEAQETIPDLPLEDDEDFLKPVSKPETNKLKDGRQDVTQEDIDALLTEPEDEEETEDDILISQDDIDTLLMAADQQDEDILGDLTDQALDAVLDEELGGKGSDEESSEEHDEEELEEDDEEDSDDKVVLEGDDEVAVKTKKKKKQKSGGPAWYKKKLVLACASVLVVLGIAIPAAYFFFFSGEHKAPEVASAPEKPETKPEKHPEAQVETAKAPEKPIVIKKNPGNMILKGFVVLAPDKMKNMVYIMADISIDYADQKAFQEIVGNMPYVRDLIYDSMVRSLAVEKQEAVTEATILSAIESALKKILSPDNISKVSFLSFKTG